LTAGAIIIPPWETHLVLKVMRGTKIIPFLPCGTFDAIPIHCTKTKRVGGVVEESRLESRIAKGFNIGWLSRASGGRVRLVTRRGHDEDAAWNNGTRGVF